MKRLLYLAIIMFGIFFIMTDVYWCNYCIQNDMLGMWLFENTLLSLGFLIIVGTWVAQFK